MRRLFAFILTLTFIIGLVGCDKSKITYTKEYPFLPAYENMESASTVEPYDKEISQMTYIVKNVKFEDFLTNYEKILTSDGWKVAQDNKPSLLRVEKEKHVVIIMPQVQADKKDEIKVFIVVQ